MPCEYFYHRRELVNPYSVNDIPSIKPPIILSREFEEQRYKILIEEIGLKFLWIQFPYTTINFFKLGDFSIIFTWKNGGKCRAYLFIVLVVVNPCVSPP